MTDARRHARSAARSAQARIEDEGELDDDAPRPIVHEVASALSPYVRRIVADNPGAMTGPGTNTYLVGIDEIAVIDPGPDTDAHLDAIAGCGGDRIRWILLTHTHPDHSPGAKRLKARTGAEICAFDDRDGGRTAPRMVTFSGGAGAQPSDASVAAFSAVSLAA